MTDNTTLPEGGLVVGCDGESIPLHLCGASVLRVADARRLSAWQPEVSR
jgi:hypothetical protein